MNQQIGVSEQLLAGLAEHAVTAVAHALPFRLEANSQVRRGMACGGKIEQQIAERELRSGFNDSIFDRIAKPGGQVSISKLHDLWNLFENRRLAEEGQRFRTSVFPHAAEQS